MSVLLQIHGSEPRPVRTAEAVFAALSSLRAEGRAFAILERDSSYVQAAGSCERLTVEWRSAGDFGFRHWVVGRDEMPGEFVEIQCAVGPIMVQASEILTADEAAQVFRAFLERTGIPERYRLRDVTSMFVQRGSS